MRQYLIAALIALTTVFTGCCEHKFEVREIETPQSNGTVARDYARIDVTDGTMCSLHEAFWLNGAFVEPCN
jgi:hypothetical protein